MPPLGGPSGMTPCSGDVNSLGRHAGSHCASDARFLVLRRTIAVSGDNGVPRAEAHYCTNTRNPSSPYPLRYFKALWMPVGSRHDQQSLLHWSQQRVVRRELPAMPATHRHRQSLETPKWMCGRRIPGVGAVMGLGPRYAIVAAHGNGPLQYQEVGI